MKDDFIKLFLPMALLANNVNDTRKEKGILNIIAVVTSGLWLILAIVLLILKWKDKSNDLNIKS